MSLRETDCRIRLAWEGYAAATFCAEEPAAFLEIERAAFYAGAAAVIMTMIDGHRVGAPNHHLNSMLREFDGYVQANMRRERPPYDERKRAAMGTGANWAGYREALARAKPEVRNG
jgi:hypothetical protein